MLHVLYIIINISCPRKRIKNRGMSCNLFRSLRIYGVNSRSENFLLLSDLLFARGRCTRSRYKRVVIRVVLGCVLNFMMCSKVIYTCLISDQDLDRQLEFRGLFSSSLCNMRKTLVESPLKIWLSIR